MGKYIAVRHRPRVGFSYMETLVAMAVFCILLVPVFPMVSQALGFAYASREGYDAHLKAQELMLVVREAVDSGTLVHDAVLEHVSKWEYPLEYGCWVEDGEFFTSENAPEINVTVNSKGNGILITTAVWDSENRLQGKAAGLVNP